LDAAFAPSSVEKIFDHLEKFKKSDDAAVAEWAEQTLANLNLRSPTSLKVALEAVRKGKKQSLKETIQMELGIATAFCVSYWSSIKLSGRSSLLITSPIRAAPAPTSRQA
jgi:3-hydroxyisobutyryl-CoA hydrolase